MRSAQYGNATIQQTAITIALTAGQTIAAARPGSRVVVLSMILSAAGAVAITFNSKPSGSAVPISGAMTLPTGVPVSLSAEQYGCLRSAVDEGMTLTLSTTVQVSGTITWVYSNDAVDT